MSFLQLVLSNASANATPFRLLTGAGVGVSAYLLLANVGARQFGIMPMVKDPKIRQQMGISVPLAVREWNFFFTEATAPVVGGCLLSSAVYLAASFFVPGSGSSENAVSWWLRLSAVSAISPLLYTLQVLLPVNSALVALAKREEFTSTDEDNAQRLLDQWAARHDIRMCIYASSLVLGSIALLAV